ncbi:MAG TPA: hypothetical protein VI382_03125 [Candidatus Manganitrophaceae bacterium]|nr:hypothetical protein [Candidatus Manganitrophaceae bacterium]
MSEKKEENASGGKEGEKKETKETLNIPLRFIPNENEETAQEMKELFDEDKVTHRQGSSEPEAD